MHCINNLSKVCVKQRLEAVCDEPNIIFIKFACIILIHWHVISIVCKITFKQFINNTCISWMTCKYGAHDCQIKIEMYHLKATQHL